MFYSKALLTATYKEGRPGPLTAEHKKAEHHRFKTQYLFKNTKIPKDLYVSRLIQHFLIIKGIETQLQTLSLKGKSEINPFFALSYLQHLWRTPGIQSDLHQLGVNTDKINDHQIAQTTKSYLKKIEELTPKTLLAHFLLHVAGFMHGGTIIRSKYIEPSNQLTDYQIATCQYDFSSAAPSLSAKRYSPLTVYHDMMKQVDTIALEDSEYEEILEQGKTVYETMSSIYDDLCNMHGLFPHYSLAVVSVSIASIVLILKLLADFSNPMNPTMSPGPM
ncbi:heme oxygenase [Legionella antarctica]|uniref:Heme oxygenase n=1 Tax=Legionella antarctica TaxID=2708020 RepID=A0A6F8T188_9GAMM|nr:biliverdin-producing heme oxygenase [Legionella antarctica]BCA93937.1 heme oxygenase [Legionella antarctica]